MVGIHGKLALLKVSTQEVAISGVQLWGPVAGVPTINTSSNGTYAQALTEANRNWRYDRDTILIQFTTSTVQGMAANVNDANGVDIGIQTRLINYAGGAIHMAQYPTVHSGIFAMASAMQLTSIGNIVGDARSFSVNITSDSLDSTVIGDSWKSFEDGLAGFEGTLDGLVIDNFWYKQAMATLSGIRPRIVLRLNTDPKRLDSFYQGTVVFPSMEITGGFDALIERTNPFQGRGPLDLIERGIPFFKTNEGA